MGKFKKSIIGYLKILLGSYLAICMPVTFIVQYQKGSPVRDLLGSMFFTILNLWSLGLLLQSGFFNDN